MATQTIDRLAALRVGDVMTKDVLTVEVNQTMPEAARLFTENHVSSAPVVDELGHCVGVLTATDFVKRESSLMPSNEDKLQLVRSASDQAYHCVPVDNDYVRQRMSPAVQSIDADASLLRASRVMCNEHIHRLFVIDPKNHPIGVVSTMDIVAAMVNVIDEMETQAPHLPARSQQN